MGESNHPFFDGIADGYFVYFVHSYAAQGCVRDEVLASVDYGGEIVSVVGRKNIVATQFHPEKSQAVGLRMIRNFLAM
jgi:glutamine amidotransferase